MSIFAIKSVPSKNNEKIKNGRKQNGRTNFTEIVKIAIIGYHKYKIKGK